MDASVCQLHFKTQFPSGLTKQYPVGPMQWPTSTLSAIDLNLPYLVSPIINLLPPISSETQRPVLNWISIKLSPPFRYVGITHSVQTPQHRSHKIQSYWNKMPVQPQTPYVYPNGGQTRQMTSNLHASLPLVDTLQPTRLWHQAITISICIDYKQHSLGAVTRSCVPLLVWLINRVHCSL